MDIHPCLVPSTMVRYSRTSSLGENLIQLHSKQFRKNHIEIKALSSIYMVSFESSST